MKTGYLELNLLLLFIYVSQHLQISMAKHPHHHYPRACHKCPPGFGVTRPCARGHDTECAPCEPDHYSAHRSAWRPCYPCSRCGAGLYVAHPCTARADTVCDSCHTYRGPHNRDFYERCVQPLLVEQNSTAHSHSAQAKESQSVTSLGLSSGFPTSVVVASSVVVAALVVALAAACVATTRCRTCRRGDKRYPYIAVSTKEAVML